MELNNDEILIALGLASLEKEDANKVLRLFFQLLGMRVGRRVVPVLGAGWVEVIDQLRKRKSAEADEQVRELLAEVLPDHPQYAREEMMRTIDEFVARLDSEIAGRASSV